MNTRYLFLALTLLAILATASAYGKRSSKLGGLEPIKNLHDKHVQEIANFAVTENNRRKGKSLEFVKIVKGETMLVGGTMYRLVIAAKDGDVVRNYQAIVYEKTWAHFRSLLSFNATVKIV